MILQLSDHRDSGEVERRKMTAAGDSLSLVVQNLRPGTAYEFRVSAENKHGVSRESQTVSAQMLDEGEERRSAQDDPAIRVARSA